MLAIGVIVFIVARFTGQGESEKALPAAPNATPVAAKADQKALTPEIRAGREQVHPDRRRGQELRRGVGCHRPDLSGQVRVHEGFVVEGGGRTGSLSFPPATPSSRRT